MRKLAGASVIEPQPNGVAEPDSFEFIPIPEAVLPQINGAVLMAAQSGHSIKDVLTAYLAGKGIGDVQYDLFITAAELRRKEEPNAT